MPEDFLQMSVRLKGEDLQFYKTIKDRIGSTTDVGVFFFILAQYKRFVMNDPYIVDLQEARDALKERLSAHKRQTIQNYIETHPDFSYATINAFIDKAVDEYLLKLKQEEKRL